MKSKALETQKMAAAVSAVFGYIRAQEDAAALALSMAEPVAETLAPATPAAPVKLWSISARQDMMGMRQLMQLRTFQRKTG